MRSERATYICWFDWLSASNDPELVRRAADMADTPGAYFRQCRIRSARCFLRRPFNASIREWTLSAANGPRPRSVRLLSWRGDIHETSMTDHPVVSWHRLVRTGDPSGLNTLLAEDAVFYSPVVHSPQRGKALTVRYLPRLSTCSSIRVFAMCEIIGDSDAMPSSRQKSMGCTSTVST